MRTLLRGGADLLLGNAAVAGILRAGTRDRLRILAYHAVEDEERFAWQMEYVRRHFRPVSEEEVVGGLEARSVLPERAVWITFDDGDPSLVGRAAPVLRELGLPSTAFVCPGLIGSITPFWWEVVERADRARMRPPGLEEGPVQGVIAWLKRVGDAERRRLVASLADRLENSGEPLRRAQLRPDDLRRYVSLGGSVGNHTWDHPCLDRCDAEEQRRQIVEAHRWLTGCLGHPPVSFAYPNGNFSVVSAGVLRELGYRVGVLFDHRLARVDQPPLALSRLRTDDRASRRRFVAMVSGGHPALSGVRRRLAGELSGGEW